jgi:predicted DNA-binding ribbon-helix-helix protein
MDASPVRKRSIEVRGTRTSVSLEEEFWAELQAMAASRGLTMERLVGEIDAARVHHNRSSALRIYALRWAKGELN